MKVLKKTLSDRTIALMYLSVLILGTGFLIALSFFTAPYYDDYGYGFSAKYNMASNVDIVGAVVGAAHKVKEMWWAWQGTHSSIFFMSLMPAIWGEQFYCIGSIVLIVNLLISLFILTGIVLFDVFGIKGWKMLGMQSLVSIIIMLFIYSAQQGFYWFNGGFHYVGMHSYFFVFVACLVHLVYEKNTKKIVILVVGSILLGVVLGGGNFITGLQTGLFIVSLILLLIIKKNKRVFLISPCLIFYAYSYYKSVAAPGNAKRANAYIGWGMPAGKAVVMSFVYAFKWAIKFSNIKFLILLVLLIPLIWRIVSETKYVFRLRVFIVLAVWSVCFFASSFTPNLYSTGEIVLDRLINVIKFNYQMLFIMNMFYGIGVIRTLCISKTNVRICVLFNKWKGYYSIPVIVMLVALFALFFRTEPDRIGNYSYYGAGYYLFSGEAGIFHSEYVERVNHLKGNENDLLFEEYSVKPWFLICEDLSDNPESETNRYVAIYYAKSSVVVGYNN